MAFMTYFPSWKAYAIEYTPSVDTVFTDFSVILSYVNKTGSYYIGWSDKPYDVMYAGSNRTIQGAIWTNTSIYKAENVLAKSNNTINLYNDCTRYTGYEPSKEYNVSKFTFNDIILKANTKYYIGIYDTNSKANKNTNGGTLLIQQGKNQKQLWDCINVASTITKSVSGKSSLVANFDLTVNTKPNLTIDFYGFIDDRKTGLQAKSVVTSSMETSDLYDYYIYFAKDGTDEWKYKYIGKYADLSNTALFGTLEYAIYNIKAVVKIGTNIISESNIIQINGTRPIIHLDYFSYVSESVSDKVPFKFTLSTSNAQTKELTYYCSYGEQEQEKLGTSNAENKFVSTLEPILYDYGTINFFVKNDYGVYSSAVAQYFDCVRAKIISIGEVRVTSSSATFTIETSYSPNIRLGIFADKIDYEADTEQGTQVLTFNNLRQDYDSKYFIGVENTINGSWEEASGHFRTKKALWQKIVPYVYRSEAMWNEFTCYVYVESEKKFVECDLYMAEQVAEN